MSLSTERNAAIVTSGEPPEMLFPVFGKDADSEKEEIKSSYPDFVPGKRQVFTDEEIARYRYYQAAAAHYKNQHALMSNRIRFGLGDAEYGTDSNGTEFVQRRKFPVEGYPVPSRNEDSLYPVRS